MTRKRVKKLLMSSGISRNTAQDLIECLIAIRRLEGVISLTVEFTNGQKYCAKNVRSYREIYKGLQKDGMPLV